MTWFIFVIGVLVAGYFFLSGESRSGSDEERR